MSWNVVIVALTVILVVWVVAYAKMRPLRAQERLAAMGQGKTELFFSDRLLHYIPWQFWTSVSILIGLTIAFFISAGLELKEAQTTFLELIKYVTGAVIGSLFGKSAGNGVRTGRGARVSGEAKPH